MIEYRHGYLVPLNERKKTTKYNNPLLVCEFCQGESTRYKTGKVSGKSLCISCYNYEYFHGHLVPLDERKYYGKHKDNVLVCEFCQNESIQYKKSQVTGKSLCQACYQYEYKNDCLVPLNERKQFQKHKDYIIACEICQKENTSYITGKVTGKSLCKKCYMIEYQQSHMLDLDGKHSNILVFDRLFYCIN
jgi:formylmethanofuran dehydrogenase subunit E